MLVSREWVKRVVKFCINEYFAKPPYDKYVIGCGVTKVGIKEPNAPDKDDFCVYVMLRKRLPRNLSILTEKDGVRIYTEVVGEIRAL